MLSAHATSAIQHLVIVPENITAEISFFQRFALKLLNYLPILREISIFPHDVLEALLSNERYVISKMDGSPLNVGLLRVDLLEEAYEALDGRLTVFWTSEETSEAVSKIVSKLQVRPLHISTSSNHGAIYGGDLTPAKINEHLDFLVASASTSNPEYKEIGKIFAASKFLLRSTGELPFPILWHNCTVPLLRVLEAYGYAIDASKGIPPMAEHDIHINEIIKLVEHIDALRLPVRESVPGRKNDAIVFCPSMCAYLYDTSSFEWNKIYRDLDKDKRTFLKELVKNKGYSNSALKLSKEFSNPYDDPKISPFLMQRQFELRVFTEFVSIVAVNQFVPAVRLPHGVMLHHSQLRNIYALIKSATPKNREQLVKKVLAYVNDLKKDIGEKLLSCILDGRQQLLAMCDFPIEWISSNGLPIMFSHEISRIPSTPGDLFGQVAMAGERVMVPLSDLFNILVIRSFAEEDPIKNHTETAIAAYGENGKTQNLNVKILDVKTVEEVETALNEFAGSIVIFDCHGDHGGSESHAWLHIGKEKLDVWSLANRARVPPIAILSACSTHAINGSHASVANGLLRSGAICVLGTYAPVNSIHASIIVGRLLYRISAFLPLVLTKGLMTWRTVVSGFLRMSYVSDILMEFMRRDFISEDQVREIHLASNLDINSFDSAWHANLMKSLQVATGIPVEKFKGLIESDFQFVDTMIWTQLGRPENIVLYDSDRDLSAAS